MARSLKYGVGDVFALPLRDHGWALGVVARMDGRGAVLGYFFGPRIESLEGVPGEFSFDSRSAIRVCRFGDLGFIQEKWRVVGSIEAWDAKLWPVPDFCRQGHIRVVYDERTLSMIHEESISPNGCRALPRDGLEGSGYVEIQLTRQVGAL